MSRRRVTRRVIPIISQLFPLFSKVFIKVYAGSQKPCNMTPECAPNIKMKLKSKVIRIIVYSKICILTQTHDDGKESKRQNEVKVAGLVVGWYQRCSVDLFSGVAVKSWKLKEVRITCAPSLESQHRQQRVNCRLRIRFVLSRWRGCTSNLQCHAHSRNSAFRRCWCEKQPAVLCCTSWENRRFSCRSHVTRRRSEILGFSLSRDLQLQGLLTAARIASILGSWINISSEKSQISLASALEWVSKLHFKHIRLIKCYLEHHSRIPGSNRPTISKTNGDLAFQSPVAFAASTVWLTRKWKFGVFRTLFDQESDSIPLHLNFKTNLTTFGGVSEVLSGEAAIFLFFNGFLSWFFTLDVTPARSPSKKNLNNWISHEDLLSIFKIKSEFGLDFIF